LVSAPRSSGVADFGRRGGAVLKPKGETLGASSAINRKLLKELEENGNIRTLSTMAPEEKFAIEKPKQSLLDELVELVDQIEDLAHQKAPYGDKLNHLNARLPLPTTIEEICSYYGACTRDEFLSSHLIPNPYQHKNLTDTEMLWLISQVSNNLSDTPLVIYYGTILETNTSSTRGRVIDLVVFKNIKEPQQVLAELKKGRERVIHL
jgi:hypothetical protein